MAPWSATVTPGISSITSTRRVDSDWYTARCGHAVVVGEVLEEHDAARRLGAVVELLLQRGDELLGEPLHAELVRGLDPTVDHPRRHAEHRRVAVDDVLDAGPLHLHHDVLAGLQHRPVRLADGGRRERLEVERRELLLDDRAQLALEDLTHLRRRRTGRGRRLEHRRARS